MLEDAQAIHEVMCGAVNGACRLPIDDLSIRKFTDGCGEEVDQGSAQWLEMLDSEMVECKMLC